jgi:phage terminase large subunit
LIGHGAILARLVERAEREGRIGDHVEYDPEGPGLDIVLDIGFRDTTACWFVQRRVGGRSWLDYDDASGLDADEWCARIKERIAARGYKLGTIWLPHDARARTFNSRFSAMETFLKTFGLRFVRIVPDTKIPDRVNAARKMVPKSEFHATRCAEGLEALRAWSFEWNEETGTYSKTPVHDWASHSSDSYSYGAVALQEFRPPPPETETAKKPPLLLRGIESVTVDELIAMTPRERRWA